MPRSVLKSMDKKSEITRVRLIRDFHRNKTVLMREIEMALGIETLKL